jgi:hypothetical protein
MEIDEIKRKKTKKNPKQIKTDKKKKNYNWKKK